MCPIPQPTCSWWTETHSGNELVEHTLLPAWKSSHYKSWLKLVSSGKSAASLCIASGGKYCTQSLSNSRETKLQEHSLSLELLPTDSICPSVWYSFTDASQGGTSHYSVYLGLVKINPAFIHLFGCHISCDASMMGGKVPTFFLGKHE